MGSLFAPVSFINKVDPHLEDRSKLVFNFPGTETQIPRVLNFMENIKISEKGRAKYSEYNPIGRNGSAFIYLGAESRSFSLDFSLTLLNIIQNTRYKPNTTGSNYESKYEMRKEYFEKDSEGKPNASKGEDPNDAVKGPLNMIDAYDKVFLRLLDDSELATIFKKAGTQNAQGLFTSQSKQLINARRMGLACIIWWVNLIRSSVFTSSMSPYLGPPILRLNHGILYQNVPCIVESYSIDIDKDKGYDNRTLLPNEFKISMNLREVRLSSRSASYKAGDPGQGDIQPGWDSLLEGGATLDPVSFDTLATDYDFTVSGNIIQGASTGFGSNPQGTDAGTDDPTVNNFYVSW